MKGILIFLLVLAREAESVGNTTCFVGQVQMLDVQEWIDGVTGAVQYCIDNQWARLCLDNLKSPTSYQFCEEFGLSTKRFGYYTSIPNEDLRSSMNGSSYVTFTCNNIEEGYSVDCDFYKVDGCLYEAWIYCGNTSDGSPVSPISTIFTTSSMYEFSEIDLPPVTTVKNIDPTTAAPNNDSTADINREDCIMLANMCISLSTPVLGVLCVILGVTFVGVVLCWIVTCYKLRKVSIGRCNKMEDATNTNNLEEFPNNFTSVVTPLESIESKNVIGKKADFCEVAMDSVLGETGGEGHGRIGGMAEVSEQLYQPLDGPQDYEEFYQVMGKKEDNSVVTEVSYRENTMHSVAGQTGQGGGGGEGGGEKTPKSEVVYYTLEEPQEYEEFYHVVGKMDNKSKVNDAVYKNVARMEERGISIPHGSSETENFYNNVENEVASRETMHLVEGETGGGRGGEGKGGGGGRGVGGRGTERGGKGGGEGEGGGGGGGRESDKSNTTYHVLEKPQEYEEYYQVMGNGEDAANEVIYNNVEREELDRYSSLVHSNTMSSPQSYTWMNSPTMPC